MSAKLLRALSVIVTIAILSPLAVAQQKAQAPDSVRLYVFDCGQLNIADISVYQLKREEIATNLMSVPCFLIAHPRGNLMWDVGAVPDSAIKGGAPGTLRAATSTKTLQSQMAAIGYAPGNITHLAFSHFHWDHVGNANVFAGATWLVPQSERELMFADPPSPRTEPANFSALKNSRTVPVGPGDYDVFGDGTVVIKATPGHSPGHQVLFVKLARTGPVVLSGDLYHYPEERALKRVPTTEFNAQQTIASRAALESFLQQSKAQLWIEHDFNGNAKLRKSPAYYD
jgi:glyoxylase-like metal-dependent hydrolase (beta-lactamase superfamily II)